MRATRFKGVSWLLHLTGSLIDNKLTSYLNYYSETAFVSVPQDCKSALRPDSYAVAYTVGLCTGRYMFVSLSLEETT